MDVNKQGKIFNDPVHGHVELHPLLIKIIDTPQFQRLRFIKQVGGVYFVYPGASHNRFEHSIGVAYLAGELARSLKTRQPELKITDRDILCVQIAGLCHDLGHGPFSHLYDDMFLPETTEAPWKHEIGSCKMFDHLINNELNGSLSPEERVVIKEMIYGKLDNKTASERELRMANYPTRKDKSFLYNIVSNKRNGVDVDKFDYLARDFYHLGIQNNFDHNRFLKFARVCEVDGEKQICFRDKEKDSMYDLYYARYCLHKRACFHKVNVNVQVMIKDALVKADDYINIEVSGGKMFKISTAKDDMQAYTKLTDNVFQEILDSSSDDLKPAREILTRILRRDLYVFLGQVPTSRLPESKSEFQSLVNNLVQRLNENDLGNGRLTPDDIAHHKINFTNKENPMATMYFYKKDNPDVAERLNEDEVRRLDLKHFVEPQTMFFCKPTDRDHQRDIAIFNNWKEALPVHGKSPEHSTGEDTETS